MKNLKTFIVAIALFVGTTSFVNAQSKVAHINVQTLLTDMPEMKAAQAELKKLEQSYTADIQNSMKELQNKATQYQNEAEGKTDEENQKRGAEIQGMQGKIQQAQQSASQELQKKQVELLGPITKKAEAAIQKVARGLGYNYVMDASPGTGVILAEGKDLLSAVKKELGF